MTPQSSAQQSADTARDDGGVISQPPIEARLVQAGKLSMGQLAQAHRDRLESGQPLLDIIVERGWVTREEIAEVGGEPVSAPQVPEAVSEQPATPVPAPEPASTPEPKATPEPEATPAPEARSEPVPETPKTAETHVLVGIRLTTGDLVPAGHANDPDTAATLGQAVVAELTQAADDEWPFFDGRFIKPETIVSVDLVVEE